MPLPQHCIDCDKVATVKQDGIYYCASCAIKILYADAMLPSKEQAKKQEVRESAPTAERSNKDD